MHVESHLLLQFALYYKLELNFDYLPTSVICKILILDFLEQWLT